MIPLYNINMSRRYEPDPVRLTSMEDYEACEKQLLDTLTRVLQQRDHLLNNHLSSYEASTMQQSIAGPFVNDVVEGWLPESGHNQTHLFDASAHANQLRYILLSFLKQLIILWKYKQLHLIFLPYSIKKYW